VGRGPGMLPLVTIAVAMFLGGISGSGPACAAAVGAVMIGAMKRAGYPGPYAATIVGAGAATDILIPPSIAFIVYSVLVPQASVPALFAAGLVPGFLVGLALIIPAVWMARHHNMGQAERDMPRPPFWRSLYEAIWGLAAPAAGADRRRRGAAGADRPAPLGLCACVRRGLRPVGFASGPRGHLLLPRRPGRVRPILLRSFRRPGDTQ